MFIFRGPLSSRTGPTPSVQSGPVRSSLNLTTLIWAIKIQNELYQMMLGFYHKSHINKRNKYVGKFKGLSKQENTFEMLNILITCDAKYIYKKPGEDHIICADLQNRLKLRN